MAISHSAAEPRSFKPQVDFSRIAKCALDHAHSLVPAWCPGGQRQGQEWLALNPKRADRSPGSFRINLATGKWADFAVGRQGGDLIALFAYLNDLTQAEAAETLAKQLRIEPTGRNGKGGSAKAKSSGKIAATYSYLDEQGDKLFEVVRYEPKDLRQRRTNGKGGWIWNTKGVRPVPYHLPEVTARVYRGGGEGR
jgi:hypothetical protein